MEGCGCYSERGYKIANRGAVMKTQTDIKVTVIPPRLEEEEVYIQPVEKDADCILGDFLDENQIDGFSILEEDIGIEEGSYNEG